MIDTEVPRSQRSAAVKSAVDIMNTFNKLANAQNDYGTQFSNEDMLAMADVYSDARQKLARFFDYLPQEAKDRFYNYNKSVRDYEAKELKEEGIERMKL